MAYTLAGIDVHKKLLMVVVVRLEASQPAWQPERRRFGTTASELRRPSAWLREQEVEEAVMESTAQYWKPVWYELEGQMRLQLAQAFSNRAPRGRKHDFKDAERLLRRLVAAELILSFVPPPEQRLWRTLTRTGVQLARDRVRLHSQMECLLEEMRIKLSSVISDLFGVSGQRILQQLAEGDRPAEAGRVGRYTAALHGRTTARSSTRWSLKTSHCTTKINFRNVSSRSPRICHNRS
jgi:transposase